MTHFYDLVLDQVQSEEEIERGLIALLDDRFDVPTLSRFVLGRYWRSASAEEREEYQNIFSTYIVKSYFNTAIDRSESVGPVIMLMLKRSGKSRLRILDR